jgi:hypothetical protein
MQLAKGNNRLRVPDVSKALDPHSVLLRWQSGAPNPPQLVAHSYDLGVDSSDALLKRYLGKPVELVRYGPNGREAERQQGTLMVEADGAAVVQQVGFTFYNREKSGLGVPLPQGAIRIYEPDRSRSLRYAGAAGIENTPRDQKVQFTLASAFDLFTEARVVKKQKLSKHTVRKQIEVVLHNEKQVATNLRVVQGFGGRWKVVHESFRHVNLDASTVQWRVKLPAAGKVTLGYTVELMG